MPAEGGPERILDLTLRTGPFGDRYGENPGGLTLDMLKANPNGIDFGPMVPQLPDVLGTADEKIRLAPQYLLDDLPRLAARLQRAGRRRWCWSAADTCGRTTPGCTTCPR